MDTGDQHAHNAFVAVTAFYGNALGKQANREQALASQLAEVSKQATAYKATIAEQEQKYARDMAALNETHRKAMEAVEAQVKEFRRQKQDAILREDEARALVKAAQAAVDALGPEMDRCGNGDSQRVFAHLRDHIRRLSNTYA